MAFRLSVNPMSAAIHQLPLPGGPMDQTGRAAAIWLLLQEVFVECMPKDGARGLTGG